MKTPLPHTCRLQGPESHATALICPALSCLALPRCSLPQVVAIITGRLVPCRENQLQELDAAVGEQLEPGGGPRGPWMIMGGNEHQ